MDNIAHEFPLDTALAAAHLFCASSDVTVLRKMNRLAVLLAAAFREAASALPASEELATNALVALLHHLNSLPTAPLATASSAESRSVSASLATAVVRQASLHELSPCPSSATPHSALSVTLASSSVSPAQTWKSVAEMQQLSARDCDLDAAAEGATPTSRNRSGGALLPLQDEAAGISRHRCSASGVPLLPVQEEEAGKGLIQAPAAAVGLPQEKLRSLEALGEESTSQQRHQPMPPFLKCVPC
jgi:hypothetical protein